MKGVNGVSVHSTTTHPPRPSLCQRWAGGDVREDTCLAQPGRLQGAAAQAQNSADRATPPRENPTNQEPGGSREQSVQPHLTVCPPTHSAPWRLRIKRASESESESRAFKRTAARQPGGDPTWAHGKDSFCCAQHGRQRATRGLHSLPCPPGFLA